MGLGVAVLVFSRRFCLDQFEFHGQAGQFEVAADAEFALDLVMGVLHGFRADRQQAGDFFDTAPGEQVVEDLEFTRAAAAGASEDRRCPGSPAGKS